jgi:hypothetical protein
MDVEQVFREVRVGEGLPDFRNFVPIAIGIWKSHGQDFDI